MTWQVVWTDNAMSGLRDIAAFFEDLEQGRGVELVESIFDRVSAVAQFPYSAPAHRAAEDRRIRSLVFRNYVVIYRALEPENVIQVLAVRHQRQRPVDPAELDD